MNIKAKSKLDQKTVKAMLRASEGNKSLFLLFAAGILTGLALFEIIRDGGVEPTVGVWLFSGCMMLALAIYLRAFLPKQAYNQLGQFKDCVYEYEFGEDEVRINSSLEGADTVGSRSYGAMEKVVETPEYFFLFQTRNSALAVDKATLEGGTAEDIRAIFEPRLGKKYIVRKG